MSRREVVRRKRIIEFTIIHQPQNLGRQDVAETQIALGDQTERALIDISHETLDVHQRCPVLGPVEETLQFAKRLEHEHEVLERNSDCPGRRHLGHRVLDLFLDGRVPFLLSSRLSRRRHPPKLAPM
jgi:hypothetical protein